MRKGSDNDGSSELPLEAYQAIRFFDGIARDERRTEPLVSPELVVQPFFRTHGGGRENVLVRGVEPVALRGARGVRITEGRMFRRAPARRSSAAACSAATPAPSSAASCTSGAASGRWSASSTPDGSSFESEVWVDVRELANDAKRTFPYSGIRLRAASAADVGRCSSASTTTRATRSRRSRRRDYYAKQSESANSLYVLVIGIAVLSGIGAGFGASNTMYAAVQARTAEIGTLRALGFSRAAILRRLRDRGRGAVGRRLPLRRRAIACRLHG